LPVTYDQAPEEGLATTHHPTHYTHQALIALIVSACITLAEPDTLRTAEVTAQRRVAGLATAVTVQRIDSADIMRRGITSTADALRRMAGVNLRDYGGAGGLKTVSVRGLGAGHTAVSYDGLIVCKSNKNKSMCWCVDVVMC
jgi:outer membrane cobalamin receptor